MTYTDAEPQVTSSASKRFKRKSIAPKPNTAPSFLSLPLELRLEIYTLIFEPDWWTSISDFESYTVEPNFLFSHPAGSLLLTSKHLLKEITSHIFSKTVNLSLTWPQSFTFWSLAQDLLSHLTILDVTVPSYQTYLLETLFHGVVRSGAPIERLSIELRPTHRGLMSQPTPVYLLPRFCTSSHGWVTQHLPATIQRAEQEEASLGKLQKVRYLKVHGQPEFDDSGFALSVVRLHGRMIDIANREGLNVFIGHRVRYNKFVYEAWIGEVEKGEGADQGC